MQVACRTDPGRVRDHNEDHVSVTPHIMSKGALLIIADGMGGHLAGEVASQLAAQTVRREYYTGGLLDPSAQLLAAVQAANRAVYELARADPARTGMGTTLVAAVVLGEQAYLAHVGDSRAYLLNSTIRQLTTDHSFVGGQVRAGILTPEQARRHPQRNVLTRALGAKPNVAVDVCQVTLQAGDTLLLCSDGLTEHVADGILWDVAAHSEPGQAAARLVELANEAGGADNISVIVARYAARAAQKPSACRQPPADR